jgi:hypothetical protein
MSAVANLMASNFGKQALLLYKIKNESKYRKVNKCSPVVMVTEPCLPTYIYNKDR